MEFPRLLHPFAALLGFVLGLPAGLFLTTCVHRFSYDDEFFDPGKGPRGQDHVRLSQLLDISFLPWPQRIPFFGHLIGMVQFCHFQMLQGQAHCPDCTRPLGARDRIPVLSYLWLGGRCPDCAAPLPSQGFWIEAFTPFLFALIFAVHGPTLESFLYCLLGGLCVVATVVDWNFQIIPDEVPTTGLGIGLGIGLAQTAFTLSLTGWPPGTLSEQLLAPAFQDPWHLGWCLSGALAGGLILWGLQVVGSWLAGTNAMGCGDVKLAVALGFFLGPVGSLISLFYAAVFGAFSGVLVMLSGGGKREQGFTKFAFGPYICLGTLLVTFVGPDLALEIYLKFSGLLVWMLTGKELI